MKHVWSLLLFCCMPGVLYAQHIGYLLPAGAQRGRSVEIQVAGQQFWGITGAWVSGHGVTVDKVTVIPGIPNVSYHQRRFLTTWMKNVQNGSNVIPPMPEKPEIVKSFRKHAYFDKIDQLSPLQYHILTESFFLPRHPLQMSPAISSLAIVKLTVAADAPTGRRELRLFRNNGSASNPLPFYVDDCPEIREPLMPIPPKKRHTPVFTIPSAVNGQIHPGSCDNWLFDARKGQRLVFQTFARKLVPFMGDCVPGHFQCLLEIRNQKNELLAFADDYRSDPDPVLEWVVPEDGRYRLAVRDALFRGRADFVYRIKIFEGCFQRTILPLEGWEGIPRKAYESLSGVTPLPVIVKGTLEKGKSHKVTVSLRKGEKIVSEVFARRQGSALDSLLQVYGPDGKLVAGNDDYERSKVGTVLQNADSKVSFTAPENGKYTFVLRDTAGNGGVDYGYFLRIDQPRPSFTVYIVPSSVRVFMNGITPLPVRVERSEGFDGDITLQLSARGGTFWIAGSRVIPAGVEKSVLTLGTVYEDDLRRRNLPLEVEFSASSGKIRGKVIAGDEAMQAFAYTHVIPAQSVMFSKSWAPSGSGMAWFTDPALDRITIPADGTAQIRIGRKKLGKNQTFDVVLKNAPPGLTIRSKTWIAKPRGTADLIVTLHADPRLKGKRFNLSLTGVYTWQNHDRRRKKWQTRRSEFLFPSILFSVTGGK